MPLLKIQTNAPVEESRRQALLRHLSALVAEMLGKPERYVMVILQQDQTMLFAGNDQPLAYLELKSIGLPVDRTRDFSASLCEAISEQLAIPPERIYIEFSDAQRNMWGWNGTTF